MTGSTSPRLLKLGVIAIAAGAFSGMFGVGGGTVIVPLLILWLAYGEREATGTSLVAGTALQQHLPERAVALLFSALLIAIAIRLVV